MERKLRKPKIDLQIAQRVETSEGALANSSQLVVAQIPAKHGKGKRKSSSISRQKEKKKTNKNDQFR